MKKTLIPLAIALMLFAGCSKEAGPAGPQGPKGTANITTVYYTIQSSQWIAGTGNSWYFNIPVTQITQSVLDSGAVVAYYVGTNNAGAEFEEPLPHTLPSGATYIDYLQLGLLQVDVANTTAPGNLQYKIEIITP